ncbi:MAG: tetratricopeptide repeat protein [Planctomycetes bacterium]|nr:tetratricopeptide repeat protein [Planctomycetota bacterium]
MDEGMNEERRAGDTRIHTAARLVAEGRSDSAIDLLFDAWSAEPDNLDLAVAYASLLAGCTGREAEAEDLFSSLAEDCPEDPRVWNNWGYLLLTRGEAERAVAKLERALELSPGDFEVMVNMGIALDRLDRSDESIAVYRRAVAAVPDSPVVHNNLGAALWRSGRPDEALAAFREALRINPRDASAANNMGIIKMSAGEYAEAEGFFRQALEIDSDSKAARRNLGAAVRQRKLAAGDRDGKERLCDEKPSSLF